MKKIAIVILLGFLNFNVASGQEKIKIEKQIDIEKSKSIKLFRFNSKNSCDQSKAVSVIYENKISTCFDYVKEIKKDNIKKIIKLLRSSASYGNEDVACFDTEQALVIYDKANVIIGYINI